MGKGKQYQIIRDLCNEYGLIISNKEYDKIMSKYTQINYPLKKIYYIIKVYGETNKKPLKIKHDS